MKSIEIQQINKIQASFLGYIVVSLVDGLTTYSCEKGHKTTSKLIQPCPECLQQVMNKHYEDKFFKELGYKVTIIPQKGKKFQYAIVDGFCDKGHPFKNSVLGLLYKDQKCGKCYGNAKLTLVEITQAIENDQNERSIGYTVLPGQTYEGFQNDLQVKCNKGHVFTTTWNRWDHGCRCPECYGAKKLTPDDIKKNLTVNYYFDYVSGAEEYTSAKRTDKNQSFITVKCKKAGHIVSMRYDSLTRFRYDDYCNCIFCIRARKTSRPEQEIGDFLSLFNIPLDKNNRSILKRGELDLVVPSLALAIEMNGLYWHSHIFRGNTEHKDKWEECLKSGYDLVTVFEDEWEKRKSAVISVIRERVLDQSEYVSLLDDTIVKEITKKEFNKYCLAHLPLGRSSKTEKCYLAISQEKPICSAGICLEKGSVFITRICFHGLPLGRMTFPWLVNKIKNDYPGKNILIFDNHQYSNVKVLDGAGFKKIKSIRPQLFFVRGIEKVPKALMRSFAQGPTKKYALDNGYNMIYDCGRSLWCLSI